MSASSTSSSAWNRVPRLSGTFCLRHYPEANMIRTSFLLYHFTRFVIFP